MLAPDPGRILQHRVQLEWSERGTISLVIDRFPRNRCFERVHSQSCVARFLSLETCNLYRGKRKVDICQCSMPRTYLQSLVGYQKILLFGAGFEESELTK